MYDVIIIGGGPAGVAGAVYAARKQLKTAIVTDKFGGQSDVSELIYNWIGTPEISGSDLAKGLKSHVEYYKGEYLDIFEGEKVSGLAKTDTGFSVTTDKDQTLESKTILMTAGSGRRKLTVPGAEEFDGKGVVYCASCDGPLFAGQDVVVVGGGNAGFESAAQLVAYCKSVTLLQRGDAYGADEITVNKVLSNENMTGILNAEISEIMGDKFVQGIKYTDAEGTEHQLNVTGVFVEIGQIPSTDFVESLEGLNLDKYKRIKIDPRTQKTSLDGFWAAGDCTDVLYHQNNIAAGDAVTALEDIYLWLNA